MVKSFVVFYDVIFSYGLNWLFQVLSGGTKQGPSNIKVVLRADGKNLQTTKTIDGR